MVLEFMEQNIAMEKLGRVAAGIATLAPILWRGGKILQTKNLGSFRPGSRHEQPATATKLHPAQACVGDGSAVEEGSPLRT